MVHMMGVNRGGISITCCEVGKVAEVIEAGNICLLGRDFYNQTGWRKRQRGFTSNVCKQPRQKPHLREKTKSHHFFGGSLER